MYNGRERSHEQSRALVCAGCGQKLQKPNTITKGLADVVKEEVFSGYNCEDTYFPNGICGACRNNLFKAKRGDVVPVPTRERWNSMDYDCYRPPSRKTPCACKICCTVRHTSDKLEQNEKPDVPRKAEQAGFRNECYQLMNLLYVYFYSVTHKSYRSFYLCFSLTYHKFLCEGL